MSTIIKHDEIVSKVFNNNIVLVNSDEKEKILFAKGIGFGKKSGTVIPKGTEIDKIFTIEEEENINNFYSALGKIDIEFFGVCEEAIYEISKILDGDLDEKIHTSLTDHLFLATRRLKNNEEVENPFLIEIETLYRREYNLASIVAKKVGDYSKVKIPDGEVAFIALHIHSAINNKKVSSALRTTYIGSTVVEYLERRLNIKIDRKSLDCARLYIHIKFALQRILENRPINNELNDVIKNAYKESYKIAKEIADIIGNEFNIRVQDDEISFLAIHVERFRISLKY